MENAKQIQIKRDELLNLLKKFATKKGRSWISCNEFAKESGVSMKQVLKYFVRWNAFVEAAGLQPLGKKGMPDAQKGYSRDELITTLREFGKKHQTDIISMTNFHTATGISCRPIYRIFGDWNAFLSAGGFKPHPMQKTRIPDEKLLDDYLRVVRNLNGRLPSYSEFAQQAKFSIGAYEKRFKGFKGFRRQAIQRGIQLGILQPSILTDEIEETGIESDSILLTRQPLDDRPVLGEQINIPGLLHAPVNEMGVVYLFGIMAEKLGFCIESFNPNGFPDCEGKRALRKSRWQRVRIEFEFRSSNFLQHKHDAAKCDLIVCWIHDWKDSPIEVCCLKDLLSKVTT